MLSNVACLFDKTRVSLIKIITNVTVVAYFKSQALELSWGHGFSVFLSWTLGRTSSSHDSHEVELCHQLGEKLGLKDREQVQSSHSFTRSILILSYKVFQMFTLSVIHQADQISILTYWLCASAQGFLRQCQQVSSVHQVFVEPLTSDDWEILVGD